MADDRPAVAAARPTPVLIASGALAAAAIAWFTTSLPGSWAPAVLGWIFPLGGAAVAGVAALQAARGHGSPPAVRRFWTRLALAMAVFMLATSSNLWDSVTGPEAPTQRVTGGTLALYIAAVFVVVWALVSTPSTVRVSRTARSRFLLDSVIVVTTTGLFAWYVSFRRLDDWNSIVGPTAALALVTLASMIVLTFVKIGFAGAGALERRSVHVLAATAGVGAATGMLAPFMVGLPHLSNAMLSLPVAAFGVVLAADRQRRATGQPAAEGQPAAARARRARKISLIPYAAVAATDALLISVAYPGGGPALVVAIGAVCLTGIVVYRQIAAFKENSQLLRRVDASMLELQDAQRQLAHQANHDDLTGLPNRRLFEERVGRAIDDAAPACVVLIDLDDFKTINDRLGHVLGDALLVIVGRRLQSCVRPDDTVARFGGDEFALLLRDVSAADATGVLERVGTALEQPVSVGGHDLLVQSSIGVADATPGADPTELLRRADLAMYAAKERGKGRHARYEPSLDHQAANDAQLGGELRLALDRGDFHLLYQPVVRLPDGRPAGAEALVRWEHPERGLIRPDLFIAAAERTGLIVPLGAWILNEACRQAGQWLRAYGASQPWKVSVNISARQLREPGFAEHVAAALRAAELPASRLMVEVTETAVFDNGPAVEALTEISALGVSVALDDFGTGHSSLGLLRTTPVNVLKVDKSFVDGITGSTEEAVIATAMIQIAQGLHLGAVAEGVETLEQAQRLHQLGYWLAQGYYFAKPLPPAEVGAMLAAEAARAVAA
jgi:diguanylate cyclase (GGDEF)-like protein